MTQRHTHTTKTGIALPEGSFSPSNYVGDPNGGAFVDWDGEFMAKGLPTPAAANEFGTPSMWKGLPTGFGKPSGADSGPPQHVPSGHGGPPPQGHAGPPPPHGAPPQGPPQHGPPQHGPPQGPPPASLFAAGGRQMPFAAQLAPLLNATGHPMAPQPGAQPPGAPPQQGASPLGALGQMTPPQMQALAQQLLAAAAAQQGGQAPAHVGPPGAQPPPRGAPPPRPPGQAEPHAPMSAWIDWDGAMSALMAEFNGGAPGEDPAAAPPGPPPPKPKPPKGKNPGTSSVGGRGAGGKPFTYGEDDEGAQKSLDALLEDLEDLRKGGAIGGKYLSRHPDGKGGWTYKYAHDGERVGHPEKHVDAHDRVASAMHAIGPHKGDGISVHVAAHSVSRAGDQYHTVTVEPGTSHQEKWGGSPHGLTPSTLGTLPPYEKRPGMRALSKQFSSRAPAKRDHRPAAAPPKITRNAALPAAPKAPPKPAPSKRRAADTGQLGLPGFGKSEDVVRDYAGRALSKGIYAFRGMSGADADVPEEYLYDYLCAFLEEAYEHESREPEHQKIEARDQATQMSRAVMSELVQTIPRNKNLMRAAKKFNVTRASIESILVARGMCKPRSDSQYSDDGNSAMGAHTLASAVGDFAYSRTHEIAPFLQSEFAPVTPRQVAVIVDDVSGLVKSGPVNPYGALISHRVADTRRLSSGSPVSRPAVAATPCPVHAGREIHKAQNLWNPMLPCTCHGKPNAYG